jgi:hypothetical protein
LEPGGDAGFRRFRPVNSERQMNGPFGLGSGGGVYPPLNGSGQARSAGPPAATRRNKTMTSIIKTALVAVSLVAAGLGASATTASASNVGFGIVIGGGGGSGWHGGHFGGPGWHGGPRYGRGVCAPGHALQKARGMGIRNARIVDVNHRTIRVAGHDRGGHVRAVFANDRGCPVVRVR